MAVGKKKRKRLSYLHLLASLKAIVIDTVWHMVTTRLIPIISVLVASWNIVSLEHKLEIVQLFKKDSF